MSTVILDRKRRKQVVLKVAYQKYNFLMELLGSFDFVEIEEENDCDSREEIITNLKHTAKDLKLLKAGKLKTRPARELLNEL